MSTPQSNRREPVPRSPAEAVTVSEREHHRRDPPRLAGCQANLIEASMLPSRVDYRLSRPQPHPSGGGLNEAQRCEPPPSPRRSCFGNPSIILPKEGASVSRVRGGCALARACSAHRDRMVGGGLYGRGGGCWCLGGGLRSILRQRMRWIHRYTHIYR